MPPKLGQRTLQIPLESQVQGTRKDENEPEICDFGMKDPFTTYHVES